MDLNNQVEKLYHNTKDEGLPSPFLSIVME
jgi:hypothetical protein